MIKADLEKFDKKNYHVEYKKLTKVYEEKIIDKRSTFCTVKKLGRVNSEIFDIGVYERNLKIDSYNNFQRKIQGSQGSRESICCSSCQGNKDYRSHS